MRTSGSQLCLTFCRDVHWLIDYFCLRSSETPNGRSRSRAQEKLRTIRVHSLVRRFLKRQLTASFWQAARNSHRHGMETHFFQQEPESHILSVLCWEVCLEKLVRYSNLNTILFGWWCWRATPICLLCFFSTCARSVQVSPASLITSAGCGKARSTRLCYPDRAHCMVRAL